MLYRSFEYDAGAMLVLVVRDLLATALLTSVSADLSDTSLL